MKGFLILLLLPFTAITQNNFDGYRTVCYCNTLHTSPGAILSLDNNWELFKSIPAGGTKKEDLLRNGNAKESQLQLLRDWRIIREKENLYFKNLVQLDEAASAALSRISKQVAKASYESTSADIKGYLQLLDEKYPQHIFSVLLSYIVDGLIWQELEKRSVIKTRQMSDTLPLWNGEFWFIKNNHAIDFGTNTHTIGAYELGVMWNSKSWPHIEPLYNKGILGNLSAYVNNSKRFNRDSLASVLKEYDLVNASGQLAIPVIDQKNKDLLAQRSNALTATLADAFLKHTNTTELVKQFQFASASQALIVFYHEFMWDYLDQLVQHNVLRIPPLIKSGTLNDKKELGSLLFLVQK